ncbi:MAG TPA: DegV family protein [Thermoanaerobaculia bacterium]|nr:DegV family protein [Thermoanaerobaculia bacterium]
MERPSVLLVEPDTARRRELSTGLARYGYEVIPAVTVEEGERFAARLGPGVVVASSALPGFGDASILDRWQGGAERTLVLLGRRGEDEEVLPPAVRFVPVDGLANPEVEQKVRLVLLGREVGVETDPGLETLVGDLEQLPPLELVRALHRALFTGALAVPGGQVRFDRGEVVAASAAASAREGEAASTAAAGGVKAFCRIGRLHQGPFHVRPALEVPPGPSGEAIDRRVDDLVIRAIEDASVGELPNPRSRVEVGVGPAFFSASFTPFEQELMEAGHGASLGALLDRLPQTDGEILAALRRLEARGFLRLLEPEARAFVVTDSSADLPVALARSHGIEVVPLSVRFGKKVFHDGVDLRPKRFYEVLGEQSEHPATSPPAPEDFLVRYRELLPRRDVVSVHLSEKMSQTVVHARRAADDAGAESDGHRLEVVDSGVVSLGLGLLALFAARMASRDLSAAQVARRLNDLRQRVGTLFVVDTLEYLRRGGRIGGARAVVGRLLGIKPILGVAGGEVVPVDRVRGGRAAHPRILDLMVERCDPERPLIAGVAHANAPVWADRLRRLVEERFSVTEMIVAEIGPTVGAHGGPGTVGVAWLQPSEDEAALLAPLD